MRNSRYIFNDNKNISIVIGNEEKIFDKCINNKYSQFFISFSFLIVHHTKKTLSEVKYIILILYLIIY